MALWNIDGEVLIVRSLRCSPSEYGRPLSVSFATRTLFSYHNYDDVLSRTVESAVEVENADQVAFKHHIRCFRELLSGTVLAKLEPIELAYHLRQFGQRANIDSRSGRVGLSASRRETVLCGGGVTTPTWIFSLGTHKN